MTNPSYEPGFEFLDRELDSHFIVKSTGRQIRELTLRTDRTIRFTVKYQTDHQASATDNVFITAGSDPKFPGKLVPSGYDADYLLLYLTRLEAIHVISVPRLVALASRQADARTKATAPPYTPGILVPLQDLEHSAEDRIDTWGTASERPKPPEIIVGESYDNRQFVYTVTAIDGDQITAVKRNGESISLGLAGQLRIIENMVLKERLSTPQRRRPLSPGLLAERLLAIVNR